VAVDLVAQEHFSATDRLAHPAAVIAPDTLN
jgi:hypothetical protein